MNDEIIAEARAIKDAIGEKFNYDLRALFEDIKRGEAEMAASGMKIIPPPPDIPPPAASALQRTRFHHDVHVA